MDVLVATPGRVSTLLEAEALSLEDCRAIVLDEVCALSVGMWHVQTFLLPHVAMV